MRLVAPEAGKPIRKEESGRETELGIRKSVPEAKIRVLAAGTENLKVPRWELAAPDST